MKRAIRKHAADFAALVVLVAIATGVSVYILNEQRLRFPLIEDKPFVLKATMATGQAVTPGQGQTVRVSGVRVGDIEKVELDDGRAVITMALDRKYERLVHRDAFALLRPKTGLKDMFVELTPGTHASPLLKEDEAIPISSTLPDVNPDEFLSALDADTRDYLKLLLNGASGGLKGRSDDLRAVLKRFEPTNRDIALVTGEVAKRRHELRRLIHSLNRLNTELGDKDDDLAELVAASSVVFEQFAAERSNVSATVRELPTALAQTTDTMERIDAFANVLRPAADKLRPAVRALRRANVATQPFAREAAPLVRADIRPFVREARPLVRNLRPAAANLVAAEPKLTRSIDAVNRLFNLLAYNPRGREDPANRAREEGYLYHLAWLAHTSLALFSGSDAHGVFRPLTIGGTCNTIRSTVATLPPLEQLLGLTGVLTDPRLCGGQIPSR